jgi:hypothetical protein
VQAQPLDVYAESSRKKEDRRGECSRAEERGGEGLRVSRNA